MAGTNSERELGKRLSAIYKSRAQLLKRRRSYLFFGCVCVGFAIVLLSIFLGDRGNSPFGNVVAWAMTIGFPLLVLVPAALLFYAAINAKHSEAVLYEAGFIYTLGNETSTIAFQDVKGTLFLPEARPRAGEVYTTRVVKKDDVMVGIDENVAEIPDFRKFYEMLDLTFANFLLKDITPENIYQQTISFGQHLTLCNGQFIYTNKKKQSTFSLDSVASLERPTTSHENGTLRLISYPDERGKAKKLAEIRQNQMLNIHVLCRIIGIV